MNYPKCPKCNYTFKDDEIWGPGQGFPCDHGDTADIECPSCGVELFITADYIPDWDVEISLD